MNTIPRMRVGQRKPARGTPAGGTTNFPKIAVTFEHDMFAAINTLASRNQVSFAEQVRRLVRAGLKEQPK